MLDREFWGMIIAVSGTFVWVSLFGALIALDAAVSGISAWLWMGFAMAHVVAGCYVIVFAWRAMDEEN